MSDSFTRSAVRLAGLVCRQLYWRPADFWAATPAEIAAIFAGEDAVEAGGINRSELEKLMERDQHG